MGIKGYKSVFTSKEDLIAEAAAGNSMSFKPLYNLWVKEQDSDCLDALIKALVVYSKQYLCEKEVGFVPDEHLIHETVEDFIMEGRFATTVNWVTTLRRCLDAVVNMVEKHSREVSYLEDVNYQKELPDLEMCDLPDVMERILNTLPPKKRRVIRLRYGIEDGQRHTLREVGAIMGISSGVVFQLENKALKMLRHPLRAKELMAYYR